MKINLLITYIHPHSIGYIEDLIESINQQSDENFEILFFLDKVKIDQKWLNNLKRNFFQIDLSDSLSPLEVRFKSFDILKDLEYENLVFIDADDTMTLNRVEVMSSILNNNIEIVCCDLNIMNQNMELIHKKVWEKRIGEYFEFDLSFIKDKNIIGFGNVAVRKSLLETVDVLYSKKPLVADWFIFYQLVKQMNGRAIFTSECQINYRQHNQNEAGLSLEKEKMLEKNEKVRMGQYESLKEIGIEELPNLNITKLQNLKECGTIYPFWWE